MDPRYPIVFGALLTQFTIVGLLFSIGLFFDVFEEEFGWPRTILSGSTSLAILVMGLLAYFGGAHQRQVRADGGPRRDGHAVRRGVRAHLDRRRTLAARRAVRNLPRTGPRNARRGDAVDHRALVRTQARNDDRGREGRDRDRSDGAAAVDRAADGRHRLALLGAGAGLRCGCAAAVRRLLDGGSAQEPFVRPAHGAPRPAVCRGPPKPRVLDPVRGPVAVLPVPGDGAAAHRGARNRPRHDRVRRRRYCCP